MHPSKDLFYAAVRGPDTITTFSIDADGTPRIVGKVSDELSYPWDFSVEATGRYLVAANNTSASIKVFRLDQATGTLTLVGGVAVPAQVRAVRVVFPP
jgi:6-phosphogluconolactonase